MYIMFGRGYQYTAPISQQGYLVNIITFDDPNQIFALQSTHPHTAITGTSISSGLSPPLDHCPLTGRPHHHCPCRRHMRGQFLPSCRTAVGSSCLPNHPVCGGFPPWEAIGTDVTMETFHAQEHHLTVVQLVCVCVCACVRACVRACVFQHILHIGSDLPLQEGSFLVPVLDSPSGLWLCIRCLMVAECLI